MKEQLPYGDAVDPLNNLIYQRQSGLRKDQGTETALVSFIDPPLLNLDNNQVSGMVRVDYSKAFDMVDHTILQEKLQAFGVESCLLGWFTSQLSVRSQFVSLSESSFAPVKYGAPRTTCCLI